IGARDRHLFEAQPARLRTAARNAHRERDASEDGDEDDPAHPAPWPPAHTEVLLHLLGRRNVQHFPGGARNGRGLHDRRPIWPPTMTRALPGCVEMLPAGLPAPATARPC